MFLFFINHSACPFRTPSSPPTPAHILTLQELTYSFNSSSTSALYFKPNHPFIAIGCHLDINSANYQLISQPDLALCIQKNTFISVNNTQPCTLTFQALASVPSIFSMKRELQQFVKLTVNLYVNKLINCRTHNTLFSLLNLLPPKLYVKMALILSKNCWVLLKLMFPPSAPSNL